LDLRTGEASKPSAAPTGIHYGAEFEVVRGPDEGERFPISKPVTTLGRFDDRDIQLTDSTISRKHATLTVEGNQFILRNESDRGTEVGGEAIESRALQNGDEIEMGGTVLRFHRV
jgi:pSer/pThr/pTyr-binding forkhead associated (FHA) protein